MPHVVVLLIVIPQKVCFQWHWRLYCVMHIRCWAYSLINLTWELFAGINLTWELFAGINLTWELFAGINLTWELFAGINLTWELFAGINLTWELFAGCVSDMFSPLSRLEWYTDLVVHFTVTNYTNTLQEQKRSGGWCDISHKDNTLFDRQVLWLFWLLFCIRSQHTCFSFCFQLCQICMTANYYMSCTLLFVYVSVLVFWWLFWKKRKKGFSALMFFVCLFLI